jgi:hypothetical protein
MSFMTDMLKAEGDTNPSSKRTIAFLAFLLLGTSFITELFYGMKVSQPTIDTMMYIVIGGLGFTSAEKFIKKEEKK